MVEATIRFLEKNGMLLFQQEALLTNERDGTLYKMIFRRTDGVYVRSLFRSGSYGQSVNLTISL